MKIQNPTHTIPEDELFEAVKQYLAGTLFREGIVQEVVSVEKLRKSKDSARSYRIEYVQGSAKAEK